MAQDHAERRASVIALTYQRWFVLSGVATLPVLFVGLVLARALPLQSPNLSAERVVQISTEHPLLIQTGCLLEMVAWVFFSLSGLSVTLVIRRMESDRFPILSITAGALIAYQLVILELGPMVWALAAYRASTTSPEITQALNDLGWFLFYYPIEPFMAWFLVLAVAIFRDKNVTPVFPRWFAWWTVVLVISVTPMATIAFTKSGPFAWDGFAVFWWPLIVYGTWELVLAYFVVKYLTAKRREILEEVGAADLAPPPR